MLKRTLLGLLFALILVVGGLLWSTPLALAAGNQSNQGGDRPAALTADAPNFEISVYPKPDSQLDRVGYGLAGDKVTILEQMGVNQGFSWYRVRFENPVATVGWIQGRYLTFINLDNSASDPTASKTRYLGNRSQPWNSQQGQRQYNH
jgi:hypothetical protein